MTVLVTDGNERSTLAVTRSLGRAGIGVVVGADRPASLAGASRYCHATVQYPSPYENPDGFVEQLLVAIARHKVQVFIPMSDVVMSVIGAQRARFDAVVAIPMPLQDVYDAASDKYRLMALAQTLAVPIPHTWYVPDGNLAPLIDEVGPYPLIVKPGRSRVQVDGRWVKTEVQAVATREELQSRYRDLPYLKLPSLIQRRVEGEGQGIFGLFDHGRPILLFAHRRVREKPPSGGVSVLRESVALPQPMTDYAVRLLQNVGWHGVGMVEFKVDAVTGIPYLMEINGRFWGSLQLAIDAGANFPLELYRLARGEASRARAAPYRIGVQTRWMLGDLDHLLVRLVKSDAALRLPPGYPSRWQCVRDFLRPHGPDQYCEVERRDDLGPARYEWMAYVKTLLGGAA